MGVYFFALSYTVRIGGKKMSNCKTRINRRARMLVEFPFCHWCCEPLAATSTDPDIQFATIEHLIPKFEGGTNGPENLTLACLPCNNGRHQGKNHPHG